MDKLLIGTIQGAIKRNPNVLKKYFKSDEFYFAESIDDPKLKDIDVFIQTNLLKYKFFLANRNDQYEYILKSGKPKLVMESPMFRSVENVGEKKGLYRLGWNSYQYHDSDYNNKNSPPDRWKWMESTYNIKRKDWKSNGEYVLFTMQKPGDSSLNELYTKQGYRNYWVWAEDTVKEIRKNTDRKIIIRPHINQQVNGNRHAEDICTRIDNCEVSKNYEWHPNFGASGGTGLQRDLDNAWCTVTYNSLSAVESVMSGTPVITMHKGAMAWPVAHHSLADIESLNRNIDITQWLYDSAYTSWTGQEFSSGAVWNHLKPRYEYWRDNTHHIIKDALYDLNELAKLPRKVKWNSQ
jgi:hypothetical protein